MTQLDHTTSQAGTPTQDSAWTGGLLPLLLLLCFLIATALGLYALSFLRSILVTERGNELARNAAAVADSLDRVLFERFGDIQLFANDGTLRDGTPDEQQRRLLHYKQLYWYYSWLGVADADGRIVAATDSPFSARAAALPPDLFERVRRTGTIDVGQVAPAEAGEKRTAVGFIAPIYDPGGTFRGAVASRVPVDNLKTIFEQEGRLRYGQDVYDWLLLTRDGVIISEKRPAAGSEQGPVTLAIPSVGKATADSNHSGFVEETDHRQGEPVVTGYASTRGYHNFSGIEWIVLFRQSHEQLYAPVDHLLWTVGGVGLMVILPLTGFGMWVSWQLGRERSKLLQARHTLEKSVMELGRSNADLQQFAYVASHDLQEPLRMVSSYTQLLAKRYTGTLDSDADEFIGYAVDGATRMQKLIQDLLTYSRLSTTAREFEPAPMGAVLNCALDNMVNAVKESEAVITHDRLPTVRGDAQQLAQVFQNLLSNAIKFSGNAPPRIHISSRRVENEWRFSTQDHGIGIDPQYAGRIFVIFQRLHTRAEYPGTGIGLAICKKIIERHGGRIWVESELGKGATFWFSIPDPPATPQAYHQTGGTALSG
ncbi:MAG: hypothetical protein JSR62_07495 [Nitrospira sp.]|nr:hypothetical protein [Nitrospira sp.]